MVARGRSGRGGARLLERGGGGLGGSALAPSRRGWAGQTEGERGRPGLRTTLLPVPSLPAPLLSVLEL